MSDGKPDAPVSPLVPARDGDEAQRGHNDVFPGDLYPVEAVVRAIRQGPVQAIGAGLSRRDWSMTEVAYNDLRDSLDGLARRLNLTAQQAAKLVLRHLDAG
jgi:hypothetical protein